MSVNLQGKSAPWALIEACLAVLITEYNNMQYLITLKNNGTLDVNVLESSAIKPLHHIYEAISKLLRENNIIKKESQEEKAKIETVFGAIMKLQTTFITHNK